MSSPAEQLDAAYPAPSLAPTVAPAALPQPQPDADAAYMAHSDNLRGRAAADELNAAFAAPKEPEQPASVLNKVGAVAKDVGRGLLEAPKAAAITGPRDALQAMLDGVKELGDWTNQYLPAVQLTGKGAPRIVSAEERKENPDLPGSLADNINLPKVGEPTTVTGNIVKSASQFITSMATLGRVFGPLGSDAEGALGHIALAGKSAAAVFAGFDKASGNIADLIQSVPALQNPVSEFLSSKPDDSEALGRAKNALVGAGFGELTAGVLSGLKVMRGWMTSDAPSLAEAESEATGVETPAAFKFLGDPDAPASEPLASIKQGEATKGAAAADATANLTPEQVAKMGEPSPQLAGPRVPGATEAQAKEPQVYINFARIDTQDDVKRTLSQLADAQKGNIDVAARGIQSFEATKLGAQFTDAWGTLMERRIGEPLNAEQALAGRQLLAQSAIKTNDLTDMTVKDPTPENLFAWRKQMQTHAMIQAEITGGVREAARTLSAMRIPVSGQEAVDRLGAITQQLDQMGGLKSNMDFLTATKSLLDSGKLEDLGNVAEKSIYAKTRDGLITAWTNGLLTNPLTHVKVNLSNIGTIALRLAETKFAEVADKAMGVDGVPVGEAAQTTAGLVSAIKDTFRYAGKLGALADSDVEPGQSPLVDAARAFKSGHYTVGEDTPIDWEQPGQGASNAFSIANSGWMGKVSDVVSSVVTSPGRALAGEHEFYRSIGMRMELNRAAYRQAISEANTIEPGAVAARVAQLVESPPANITTQAVDGMTYQTFTDAPGKLAESIEKIRNDYPLTRVIIPFYKIPSRIMSFTFERTPLAPLMAGWRADIAAGGARQSLALAKTGLGSALMLGASDAVLNGSVTGGGPAKASQRDAMMNQGWLPYSVKVGDRWVQYNRLETVGSSMALAADVTETVRDHFSQFNGDDPKAEELVAAGIAAIGNNVVSKTYFEGLARFFTAISDPRANVEGTLKGFAGSAVPAGASALARQMDPYQRATYTMMDAIKARTPGVSESLPLARNTWGEPISTASGLGHAYDAFVPFASREPQDSPIDAEILRLGANVNRPAARVDFKGGAVVSLDPKDYSRYQELAGNAYKDPAWGLGAKDMLNQLVSGSSPLSVVYNMKSDGPDGGKAEMIKSIMSQYRDGAKRQLLEENPALQDQVNQKAADRQALKMPVITP